MFLWNIAVTSLVEVWIEIVHVIPNGDCFNVTSLVEVWIEIEIAKKEGEGTVVTSLVEVWIEIILTRMETQQYLCHFPCGSVD